MKDIPILFTGEMVRAVLDDRKRAIRRVIKPQPEYIVTVPHHNHIFSLSELNAEEKEKAIKDLLDLCPYGKPGDRLWVRETWAQKPGTVDCAWYAADFDDPKAAGHSMGLRWRPSIHMPRWASRLTLEVTGVRAERIQDATLEEMIAEGCPAEYLPENCNGMSHAVYGWFEHLWDSIYLKQGYGYKANPWVWRVEFKWVAR